MTPANEKLLQEVEQFVTRIFKTKVSPAFIFHNIDHTKNVVNASQEIAKQHPLNEEDQLALYIAAWMHDTGYSSGAAFMHEEKSQKLATQFLQEKKTDQHLIDMVNGCIIATKMPQSPTNLIEQIICDADLAHLGSPDFDDNSKLLRNEINQLQEGRVSKKQWRQINIQFLQRQRFFTDYARMKFDPVKHQNLKNLLAKLGKKEREMLEGNPTANENVMTIDPEKVNPEQALSPAELEREHEKNNKEQKNNNKEKEKAEKDLSKTDRSVVAMFRIMSQNHVNLSQMADTKSNIMISVNTIVISIMVSILLGKLQFYPEFIIPTILLVMASLGAVIFAILATRPNVTRGTFSEDDVRNRDVNLLFFGNFYKMELTDYDFAMRELMKDKQYLYGSMIKDIYFLGVVLARKYKLLRYSYNIFMFGLIIAIVGFSIAFFFAEKHG